MNNALGMMLVFGFGWLELRGEQEPGPIECSPLLGRSELAYRRGQFGDAENWLHQALTCQEALLPPTHPHLAASYDRLAELKRLRREFGPAEALLKRAMAIWSENPGRHLAALAEAHNGLAILYYQQHRYRDAETEVRQALATAKRVLNDGGLAEAGALNTFGFLFGSLGDSVTAERHHRAALALQKAANRRDLLTASLLYNLATLRSRLGFETEAEELFRESLALYQELLPARHPQLTKALEAYAKVLKSRGMKTEARRLRNLNP